MEEYGAGGVVKPLKSFSKKGIYFKLRCCVKNEKISLGLPSIALLRMCVQERGSSAFSLELALLFKIQSVVSYVSLIRQ